MMEEKKAVAVFLTALMSPFKTSLTKRTLFAENFLLQYTYAKVFFFVYFNSNSALSNETFASTMY